MAYTGTGDVSSDTAAFQQLAYFAFRSQPMYEMVADVRSTAQTHNGASVQFNIYDNMAQATSALTETSDVTAVALGDSTVTVTLAEYGNAVITTAKLRGTSFLNVDADAANIIGYNMVDSMDKIVSDVANGGSNVLYGGDATARNELVAADVITADLARKAVAELRTASAPGFENGNYTGIVHPDVAYDLRSETAVTDVIQYQIRQDGAGVRNGSIGVFGGIEWIENPRAGLIADGGASTVSYTHLTLPTILVV